MSRPLNKSRLTAEEIVARYRAGEGRDVLALRAGIPEQRIRALLEAHDCPIRTRADVARLRKLKSRDWSRQFGQRAGMTDPRSKT